MALSELADWWDKQKHHSEEILTEWVQDNPQWWAVGIAGVTATAMDLGAGTVDVLRLGEGAARGGVRGFGKDALRLLVVLGPLARGGAALSRLLTPLAQSGRLRLAVQVGGVDGPCTFQAVNNAVSITKRKNLFVTVADMAKATGKSLASLSRNNQGDSHYGRAQNGATSGLSDRRAVSSQCARILCRTDRRNNGSLHASSGYRLSTELPATTG